MSKKWDEKLANVSANLEELGKKAADVSENVKVYRELGREAIREKMDDVKGDVAAMQENARLADEEHQGKIRSAVLKVRMTAKARHEDMKNARDKRRLENFIDDEILYVADCYNAASLLLADAELTILELAEALQTYDERFGGEAEDEAEAGPEEDKEV